MSINLSLSYNSVFTEYKCGLSGDHNAGFFIISFMLNSVDCSDLTLIFVLIFAISLPEGSDIEFTTTIFLFFREKLSILPLIFTDACLLDTFGVEI